MVKKRYLLSIFALAVAILGHATDKPNVLFIAIDDLRPNLGCYGDTQALTPNIDRLAKQGTLFERAYCQVPICMASRVALLTGIRVPDRNDGTTSRLKTPFVTMPKWFGENGYQTLSNGKIFHVVKDRAEDWSRAPWQAMRHGRELSEEQYEHFWLSPDSRNFNHPDLLNRGPYCEAADVPDNAYQDGQLAGKTIADLKQLAETGEPFFVGCGFWKPHLPFNAPKKYWDLYDPETLELAQNSFLPENGAGATGFSPEFCLYGWTGEPNTAITRELVQTDEGFWREATHGYYACASYVDAQVGKLLDALDEFGLRDNTIVVLWGDHGWLLGEHSLWGKHNTFELTMQVPLIISAPGMQPGQRTANLTETIDIYPTLCDLLGLPKPESLDGKSLLPVLENPEARVKSEAFGCWKDSATVKTDRFRYTEWKKQGAVSARMLFDHQKDPDENVNVADHPEYAEAINELSAKIKQAYPAF